MELIYIGWNLAYEVLTDTEKFTKAAGVGGKVPAFTQAMVDIACSSAYYCCF